MLINTQEKNLPWRGSDLSYHMHCQSLSHTHLTTQTHGVCHGTQRVADGLAAISALTADGLQSSLQQNPAAVLRLNSRMPGGSVLQVH